MQLSRVDKLSKLICVLSCLYPFTLGRRGWEGDVRSWCVVVYIYYTIQWVSATSLSSLPYQYRKNNYKCALRRIEKAVYLPCARCGATLEAAAGAGRGGARSPPARTPGGPVCQRCRPLRPRGHSSPHILLHSATVTSTTIKLIYNFKIWFYNRSKTMFFAQRCRK